MNTEHTKWTELLEMAVKQPGVLMKAYSAFHGYSLGNQILAMVQCQMRGIEPGPINTYPGWQKLGRQVRKGEKAIWLCMPLTRKIKNEASGDEQTVIIGSWPRRRRESQSSRSNRRPGTKPGH